MDGGGGSVDGLTMLVVAAAEGIIVVVCALDGDVSGDGGVKAVVVCAVNCDNDSKLFLLIWLDEEAAS